MFIADELGDVPTESWSVESNKARAGDRCCAGENDVPECGDVPGGKTGMFSKRSWDLGRAE